MPDPLAKQPLAKALARTYGGDRDPWDRITEYRRVRDYTAAHPQQGSGAVSTALDLPRPRIRGWVDGDARPDPMRAIDVADAKGWLDLAYGESPMTALNVLVAATFSGGSIDTRSYRPQFTCPTERTREAILRAFDDLGVDSREVHEGEGQRATEWTPTDDASLLGRLLAALGAPVGPKTPDTDLSLPAYLDGAPYTTRLDFARVYVHNRLTRRPDKPATPGQLAEHRSLAFKRDLRTFLAAVVDDADAVAGGGTPTSPLLLRPRAVALLDAPPTFGSLTA